MQKNLSSNYSEGLLEFAKYAFAPNYFSYCGPNRNSDIKQAIIGSYDQDELRYLLNSFEAAVPYLNLIARSNRIKDHFDPLVVEAYWLGNDLLYQVPASDIYNHLEDRVKKRSKKNWKEIVKQVENKAKPHHSFHVFDIYRFAGLSKDGSKEMKIVQMMNSCRISFGQVQKINSHKPKDKNSRKNIRIKSDKIELVGGKLAIVSCETDVEDTFKAAKTGDLVSVHWGMICDKLSAREAKNLDFWTRYHLNISNKLI